MRNVIYLLVVGLSACVTFNTIAIVPVDTSPDPVPPLVVESPVKAHLADGSTVMFPKGVVVLDTEVRGQGFKYDLTLDNSEPVTELSLDDVAAMETFSDDVNEAASVAATTVTTVAGGAAAIGVLKAIFGSCPTTYSLDEGYPVLEAESFSYSIAPGFEMRDVDRLGIRSGEQAEVVLEMRNEALETHYIDHVELLEVRHAPDEFVYPDVNGQPIVVGAPNSPSSALDRDGRSAAGVEHAHDGSEWNTTEQRLHRATLADLHDYIDLEFAAPEGERRQVLVLRIRNTLLNTVLLYDVMLKGQGFRALDWMTKDLDRLGPRYRLARWYRKNMGMGVLVWDGNAYKEVARVPDTGPIAWKDVAIPLPRNGAETLRLRLHFIADNWQIDLASIAAVANDADVRTIPIARVLASSGDPLPAVRENLRRDDGRYAITGPAESMRLHFDVGKPQDGSTRTWFLAAEGYYIEWMRREWLRNRGDQPFQPGDDAIMAAIDLWKPRRDSLREQFEATRIPVR